MKIIKPYFEILTNINGNNMLKRLELIARTCYKSEDLITDGSAVKFVANLIKNQHESVIEHESVSVRIVCDRGITHEIVRHRIASYSQESTRYCNYTKNKFGNEITFIEPCFWSKESDEYKIWFDAMNQAEQTYNKLIQSGSSPEQTRSVLPNSVKTEIVITMNLREWRHFLRIRTTPQSHPQMREITIPLLSELKRLIPVIFDDITP